MKTKLNLKTALYLISFAAGCAQAQQGAESRANLTVTDINGRVLMTNASYACMYQGQLFFGQGCHIEGFAAANINPALLASLGLDLRDVEVKGHEDVKKKQASDQAFRHYAQIEDEKAARRAEAEAVRLAEIEKAAREAAREEKVDQRIRNLEMRTAPVVQWVEPRQILLSSVAVLYPQFDWRNRSFHPAQTQKVMSTTGSIKRSPGQPPAVQRHPSAVQPARFTNLLKNRE